MVQVTKLYKDSVELEFDEDKHTYHIVQPKGQRVLIPSVTGMTGMIDNGKSNALVGWAVKLATEYLRQKLVAGRVYDEVQLAKLLNSAKQQHRQAKEEAGAVGSLVHEWVEAHVTAAINGTKGPKKPKNPSVLNGVNAFLEWEKAHKVEYIFVERRLASIKHWYAGTLDILAVVDGLLCVLDLKTSKSVRDEYYIQTAGYAIALEEEFGEAVEKRIIIHVNKENGMVATHDADERAKLNNKIFKTWLEADTRAFLGARELYRWAKGV